MIIRGRMTTIPNDTAVPATTVDLYRVKDNFPLASTSTSDGWYTFILNGNPGRVRVNSTYDGKVHNQWSEITGPSNGVDIGNLWMALNAFTSGRIAFFSGSMVPSANGTAMAVSVAAGAALIKGQLYDQYAPVSVTIPTSNPSNPRIDTVVVRCWLNDTGDPDEGRTELAVVSGTAAASPVAPTLANTSTIYELAIANVTVPAGATVITSGNVSPQSIYAMPYLPAAAITTILLADGSVSTAKLQDGSVTSAKIADGTIQTVDLADNSVTSAKIVDGTIATADLADGSVTSAKILDGTIATADIADSAITSAKIANGTIDTVDVKDGAITKVKLGNDVTFTGNPTLLPGSEFVATGPLGGGTRTLASIAVGPLLTGVQYDIQAEHGVTLRNNINTGTTIVKCRINGGTYRTHEFQSVGGVPRWAPVKQSASILGTGAVIQVDCVVDYGSGDATDIRAGQVSVIAIPR